ncbi:ABC transporter family substrate-binding protein [Mycobacteroides abscessus]|uniref:ABC transporter family substrate-binding protein n=1 Tax=Mycobacteroides abscessus TaxID=36809 RepID=UPI00089DCFC2|nr:ABC transporter family substrate-binding protein [Mycobacteroides abscessus]MBE5439665.1 hypothetical protein [Mycobacteroides abscessus]MBN7494449.1 ABC transporter family substrate-binding protein [Mycobacteroides abscessus subsp. abscessus]MDM2174301.1 ABC transporter family substrate-binding protein [Mycobacteroides abscessus]MDM2175731.1 ABC transporter family substrate-binding protein [Mycobacteroides abscessus]MDM2206144.1 ABC transporter family substrate-binding protein [Mycobactero
MPTDSPRLRLCAVLGVVLLAGCSVSAPPAVQGSETTSSTTPPPPKKEQIVVGIDSIGAGFNPHLLSDQSPVNSAISALVLPSAFRPVPDSATTTGSRWEMDPTLLVSAEETSQEPFTVTYTIRPEAQWTDNAPIGADDFSYLWQQMLTQPGTVDPAGYGNITDVQSRDGGKRVVVTFDHKYPAWRELFNDLLPAHIVKDIPGGFASGLVKSMPASGGRFRVDTIDPQRDEILLARNDRYWATQAVPDEILFRRAGASTVLADSIRNGDTQVAQVHGSGVTFAQLSNIPGVRTARIVAPRTLQLTLRAGQPTLTDAKVRRGLLGLLDVGLLAAVAAGNENSVTLAAAQVRSPSDPGYKPTAPVALTRDASLALLKEAGYEAVENPVVPPAPNAPAGPPQITKDGDPLTLVIGAASNDPTSVAVANTAADQLRNAGVRASVLALDPPTLYGQAIPDGRVDAIVGWHQAGGDLATALASRYGCPALQAGRLPDTRTTTPPPPPASNTPAPPSREDSVRAPSNLTGLCDEELQASIDAALTGHADVGKVVDQAEPQLWKMATVLPIMQDTTIAAAGPSVQNVELAGAVPVGIVATAGEWKKTRP